MMEAVLWISYIIHLLSFAFVPQIGVQYESSCNCAYRAIYVERSDGTVEFLEVIEVNKHEY